MADNRTQLNECWREPFAGVSERKQRKLIREFFDEEAWLVPPEDAKTVESLLNFIASNDKLCDQFVGWAESAYQDLAEDRL